MSAAQQGHAPVGVDDDLELLTEQLRALKSFAEEDDVNDGQIYDLSIRWGATLAGRLPRLVHYSCHALLNEADEAKFQALCDEMRALSGQIDRFKLAQPVLTNPPPAKAKRHRVRRPAGSRSGILRKRK